MNGLKKQKKKRNKERRTDSQTESKYDRKVRREEGREEKKEKKEGWRNRAHTGKDRKEKMIQLGRNSGRGIITEK